MNSSKHATHRQFRLRPFMVDRIIADGDAADVAVHYDNRAPEY